MRGGPTRRRLLGGAAALVGMGGAGLIAFEFGLFRRRWPASPYDDLLDRLPLRSQAVILGRAVLASQRGFQPSPTAARLRRAVAGHDLGQIAAQEAADGKLVEVRGWLLPNSVGELSALAALASH